METQNTTETPTAGAVPPPPVPTAEPPPAPPASVPPPPPAPPAPPVASAPGKRENPAIRDTRRNQDKPAAPAKPVDNRPKNKDGFVPGAEVDWNALMAHQTKGGNVGVTKAEIVAAPPKADTSSI